MVMFKLTDYYRMRYSIYIYIQLVMLLRRLTQSLERLVIKNNQKFGQAPAASHHEDEPTKHTKHNPHAIKDLRGYEHLEEAKESQKNFTNFHSTQVSRSASYFTFSFLPNQVAALLGTFAPNPITAVASDSLALPKIFPQGVPVYDSIHKTSHPIITNKLFTTAGPLAILCFVPEPLMSLFLYTVSYSAYYVFRRKYAKDIVLKLELLPNTEQIAYQKVNVFGYVETQKARISDLEYFDLKEQVGQRDYSERAVRGVLNRDVGFRLKSTGELILFDRNGVWHEEGLNHELLV